MRTEGNNNSPIPLGIVRLRVGSEHHRCMAEQPVTLVPVSDHGCGYPWWIGPSDIIGIELEPGSAYVLDVAISSQSDTGDESASSLRYELVEVVEIAANRSSAIAS